MSLTEYQYTVSGDFTSLSVGEKVKLQNVLEEIEADATVPAYHHGNLKNRENFSIFFSSALTGGEKTALDAIISNFTNFPSEIPTENFGNFFNFKKDANSYQTSFDTYKLVTDLEITDLPKGSYRLGYSYETKTDKQQTHCETKIVETINGTETNSDGQINSSGIAGVNQSSAYNPFNAESGFICTILTDNTNTVKYEVYYKRSGEDADVHIRNIRLEFWKTSDQTT